MQLFMCFTQNTLSTCSNKLCCQYCNNKHDTNKQSSEFMLFLAAELHAAIYSCHDISIYGITRAPGYAKLTLPLVQTIFTGRDTRSAS